MSLFRSPRLAERAAGDSNVQGLIPSRAQQTRGAAHVNQDTALRHSAVWASCRLRANLISTFPVDVYRDVAGIAVTVKKPPLIVSPGGVRWPWHYWSYASQFDLDRVGNTIGLITEVTALNKPARIDLQPIGSCTVRQPKNSDTLIYRIDGKDYPESKVWHERQYVVAGLPVGLSPVAYAAWSIGEYLSIQDFALDWFGGGGVPKARLKNTQKTLDDKESGIIKDRWKASIANGDLFVHGNDWEYNFMQAENQALGWLEARKYGVADVARFFDVPGDLIEAAVAGSSVTYANIVQRNLQLLIMSLGPAVYRREQNMSAALPVPQYVKLNTDALLRMDPQTRANVIGYRLTTRQIAPSEGRELENLPPFTPEQLAEIEAVYGPPGGKAATPSKTAHSRDTDPAMAAVFDMGIQ